MPNPSVRITARGSIGRKILTPRQLELEAARARREFASDAEIIFASFALHRTGRMAREIHTVEGAGGDLIIETEARDPKTGFDYVRITRFGHRTFRIVPVQRSPATVLETGRKRGHGRHASLRWIQDGKVIYRRSSRGFHPARDWADEALPQVRESAGQHLATLGRRIKVAWEGA